ncbi:hypothetical protein T4E_5726 [Trichinella pseudospiralis]|uniref:Uncharacterized protein n=1 Tax=Trichinella pseudospiralis TaxID=6337 RepID=A0A0V0Y9X8_TRIPS|nr:hypothetical protein T4E_5726 [Trichinella pseudospiralis]
MVGLIANKETKASQETAQKEKQQKQQQQQQQQQQHSHRLPSVAIQVSKIQYKLSTLQRVDR